MGAVAAAVLFLALPTPDAHAVSLGKIKVQSLLGQPLRAAIELPDLTPEEASSLTATVASPGAYKTAGVEMNPALGSLRFKLVTLDGRAILQVTSDRVINDPFIDLIVEATWSTGRLVRDYTVLLDPPELPRAAAQPTDTPAAPVAAPRSTADSNGSALALNAPAPIYSPPPAGIGRTKLPPVKLKEARRATADLAAQASAKTPPSTSSIVLGSGRSLLSPAQQEAARQATSELAMQAQAQAAKGGVVRGTPSYFPPTGGSGRSLLSPAQLEAAQRATSELAARAYAQAAQGGVVRGTPTAPSAGASVSSARPDIPELAAHPDASNSRLAVQPGDTAVSLAAANKPVNVSLDQMLAALLRRNPDAFIGGNPNRLRDGWVLELPSESEVASVSPQEASRIVVAQSRNFNDYRRRAAESASAARVDRASREAKGKVQAQVDDSAKPAAASPDKLTLSKGGGASSKGAAEDKIAADKQAQSTSARVAELSRNLDELNQLKAGASAPAGSSTGASAAKAGLPVAAAVSGASKPAATPPPATPEDGTHFLEGLWDSPMLPIGGLLLALLAVLGLMQLRQRRQPPHSTFSFADSHAGGTSRLDGERSSGKDAVSSMGYSPSQLDATGDVDPVEEADVYLAYGRDQQAEEILKEAVQRTPARTTVYLKLAEIYGRRRDAKAFDQVASQVFQLTKGQGSEWARIRALGNELSPFNTLYHGEKAPAAPPAVSPSPAPLQPAAAAEKAVAASTTSTRSTETSGQLPDLPSHTPSPTKTAAKKDEAPIEFDLGSLSLAPVNGKSEEAPGTLGAPHAAPSGPLEVKLELAVEFLAIGDRDGARALVEEVLPQASGPVKARAQQMLAELRH